MSSDHCGAELKINIKNVPENPQILGNRAACFRTAQETERKTKKYFQPNENENTAFQNALALRMQCSGMEGAAGHETSASI